jgi:hypothetical protein
LLFLSLPTSPIHVGNQRLNFIVRAGDNVAGIHLTNARAAATPAATAAFTAPTSPTSFTVILPPPFVFS